MPDRGRKLKILAAALWATALVVGVRALVIVPRQVEELDEFGYWHRTAALDSEGELWLRGRVVEAWTGEPLEELELKVTRQVAGEPNGETGLDWGPSARLAVHTDSEGRFALQVARGYYRIVLDSTGHNAAAWNRVIVGEQGQLPVDLLITAHPLCDLTVEVVDDAGSPIEGADVAVRGGDPGRAFYTRRPGVLDRTDDEGRGHWRAMCGENTVRYVQLPGEGKRFVERQIEVGPGPTSVRIEAAEIHRAPAEATDPSLVKDERHLHGRSDSLDRDPGTLDELGWGSVDARLVTPAGDAAEALVLLEPVGDTALLAWTNRRFDLTLDQGRLHFDPVVPSARRIVAFPLDGPMVTGSVFEVATGAELDLGELTIGDAAGAVAEGVVRGPAGTVGGAEVYLVGTVELGRLFDSFSEISWTPKTVTGPDGRFTLRGLPAEAIVVVAYHPGVGTSRPTELTLEPGENLELELRLEPGTRDRRSGWVAGTWIDTDRRGPYFVSVAHDSRAEEIGIVPGDRLLAIDGESVGWREHQWLYWTLSGEGGQVPSRITIRDARGVERELPWGSVPDAVQQAHNAQFSRH